LINSAYARHHHHRQHELLQFIPDVESYDQDHTNIAFGQYDKIADYQPIKGVTLLDTASDPIHGSLGADKAKRENLTPEQ